MTNVICDYCGAQCGLVTGATIYPHRHDLRDKKFYRCAPCDAYVGCHPGTETPLGRVANAELRAAKMAAHAAFDPLWRTKKLSRSQAYTQLAERMGLPKEDCHIGMFTMVQCEQVRRVSTEMRLL